MDCSRPVDDEDARVRAAVAAVRAGDRDAFSRVVELFQRRLFGLTLMMVRDPATAEEVTQDALVRAFTHLDRYDERRPFYPWLSTIAVRLAQNRLRRRRRIDRRAGAPIEEELDGSPADGPLEELIADERDRRLWRAVAALSSGERTAVVLHYRQGMTVREAARALGVTAGTVKTLLYRARHKLRDTLHDLAPVGRDGEETT
ncbi:MAG: sigma-70 family RNA polymerase sigma factor [Acidobacteriota bacterium]